MREGDGVKEWEGKMEGPSGSWSGAEWELEWGGVGVGVGVYEIWNRRLSV